jgi:guanine deaminase
LDENVNEVAEVKKWFPQSKNYLDVYDQYGLVTDQTVFGHCIHTTDEELARFKSSGAIMSWCPLSNNFLGSGLYDFGRALKYTDKITLGTDWGGGNCLSMFAVMDDAYKVSMLNNVKLPSMIRWYMATFGAAKALKLDTKIGNFTPGKEADFIVIDADASPYLKYRREKVSDIFEFLFILMTLGSEDNIAATYIYGKAAYIKDTN